MKLLLVAATAAEISPLLAYFNWSEGENILGENTVHVLIGGVGMVATAFSLGRLLSKETFETAINAGIAGSFDQNLQLGEVVRVTKDCLAELGAEDGEAFLTLDQLGFGTCEIIPLDTTLPAFYKLKSMDGITVNTVHGNEGSIEKTRKRWSAGIETMEGAAFFYSCNQFQLPSLQVRSISNYVEKRNRENWKIGLAVQKLNQTLIDFFNQLR